MSSDDDLDHLQEQLTSDLRRAAALAHLDYELLEAYVDGHASAVDRETVEAHVQDCPTCAAELRDLQNLAARRAPRPKAIWIAAACAVLLLGVFLVWRAARPRPEPVKTPPIAINPAPAQPDATEALLRDVPPAWQAAARAALRDGALTAPAVLEQIAPLHGTLRGGTTESANPLREPVAVVVQTDRPTFEWSSVGRDAAYVVSVFAPGPRLAARSPRLAATTWTPARSLARGTTYTWQLAVLRHGTETTLPQPPSSPARFHVVDAATAAEMEAAAKSGSHLAAGLAFAHAGLRREAEGEFAAVVASHPGNDAARRLLESIRSWPTAR